MRFGLCVFQHGVLTTLSLWRNKIGVEGAKAIAEALRGNGVLTSLSVDTYDDIGPTRLGHPTRKQLSNKLPASFVWVDLGAVHVGHTTSMSER